MLEANIHIEDELAVKGFRRALIFKAVKDISYFYAVRLTVVWLVISFADAVIGVGDLIRWHLTFLFILWIAASIYGYLDWHKRLARRRVGVFMQRWMMKA